MMRFKNSLVIGILLGSVFPLLAYLVSEVFLHREIIENKPGVPYLVAIAINLIFLKFVYKSNLDKAATGILLVTFLVSVLAFIFKIKLHQA